MNGSEPASPSAPHAPNHDSMVTVSLSDIQSNSEHTQPEWKTLDIPPTPVEEKQETEAQTTQARGATESFGPVALQDAARTTPTPDDDAPTLTSAKYVPADEEEDLEVDWENLDKTEEQEPRGEGSDDVGDKAKFSRTPGMRNGD